MGAEVTKFKEGKYYKIAGDAADPPFMGAKVISNKKYRQLEYKAVKADDGAVVKKKGDIKLVDYIQTVRFGLYTLNANEEITEPKVIKEIEAKLSDVTFVEERTLVKRWKNAEKNGDIIDVDAVGDGVNRPNKRIKREFIAELFKELRF